MRKDELKCDKTAITECDDTLRNDFIILQALLFLLQIIRESMQSALCHVDISYSKNYLNMRQLNLSDSAKSLFERNKLLKYAPSQLNSIFAVSVKTRNDISYI